MASRATGAFQSELKHPFFSSLGDSQLQQNVLETERKVQSGSWLHAFWFSFPKPDVLVYTVTHWKMHDMGSLRGDMSHAVFSLPANYCVVRENEHQ